LGVGISLALLFSVVSFSFADDEFGFEFNPYLGLRRGMQKEFVFYNNCTLSELDWQEKNIPVYGFETEILFNKFVLFLSAKGAVAKESGIVSDSDWQNVILGFSDDDIGRIKTNYSESDNTLRKYWEMSFGFGRQFSFSTLSFTPYIQGDFSRHHFKATNGKGYYSTDDNLTFYSDAAESFYLANKYYGNYSLCDTALPLCSMELERDALFFWFGGKVHYEPWEDFFLIDCFFSVSPWVYMKSLDTHFSSSNESEAVFYLDEMSGWWRAIKGGISLAFMMTETSGLYFSVEQIFSRVVSGTTKVHKGTSKNGSYSDSDSESGFSISSTEFRIGYKIKI
jgi:hypothetical protein